MRLLTLKKLLILATIFALAACNGGGSSSPAATSQSLTGGGVKGPLAGAVVSVYGFDSSRAGFKSSAVVATAVTDANAAINGLSLPFPISPPYIMEFTSTQGTTTDITTGKFPVITTLRTVITQSLLDTGEQIYATPLTTMAVDIAVRNALDSNGTAGIQADEFETALVVAAKQVVSTLGFGMNRTVNIFDNPPLVDNTTVSKEAQANVAAYRAAIEAVTAVAFQIDKQNSGSDTDSVLAELAADLADGGGINGSAGTKINANTLQILKQNPSTLPIPNSTTNQTVADIQAILVTEAAKTAPTTSVTDLDAGGTISTKTSPAQANPDSDGDGTLNVDDAFPDNSAETTDSDGDGIGDVADLDDNNNGILDEDENVVLAPTVTDTDGDGIDDANDNCPNVVNTSQRNTDGLPDGGDACDTDDDEDGVADNVDAFPLDATESVDTDNDGIGNGTDTDDDNDGLSDADELIAGSNPLIADTDGDGVLDGVDFDPNDNTVTFNFAPVAVNDTATTNEDVAFSISVTANDTDNDANPNDTVSLSGIGTNNTALGVIAINGNNIDYTPVKDANGTDTFTYTVTDGTFTSTGTVTVIITPVNDNPVAVNDTATTNEDTAVTTASVLTNDTDVDGDTLTVVAGDPTATTGTVVNHGDGTFTYTPNANFNGTDAFGYTVSDGHSGVDGGIVVITINAVNDAPTATSDAVTTNEDTAVTTVDVTVNDSDIDSSSLSATLLANASHGNVVDNGDSTFTYTPNANFNGADSFTYTLSDGSSSSTGTVNVTVTPINDSPVGNVDAFNAGVSTPAIMDVLTNDTDVDGDTLSITAVSAGSLGSTVTTNGSTVTFTDGVGTAGTETFTYDMSDGTVTISGILVTVTVTVNIPPVATGDSATTNEDTVVTTVNVLSNDTDGGDGPGALSISSADSSSVSGGTVTNNADGTFTYMPAANFSGADSFTYTVSDSISTSVGTVSITVTAVNDAPVATTDEVSTNEDTAVTTVNVTLNDSDIDSSTLSATLLASASNGTVVDNGNSTFTYTPNANFNGTDSFTYTLSDGSSGSATGTVNITVTAVNDAPVAVNDSATTSVNTAILTGNVLSNDTDVDLDTLIVVAGDPTATHGTVINNNNGTFTYTPSNGYIGSDSFTYSVSDSTLTDTGTVAITVNGLGTAISMSDLFSTTNGGMAGFESFTDPNSSTTFRYWSDTFDTNTNQLIFNEATYNRATAVFDIRNGVGDGFQLSPAGAWVKAAKVDIISFGTGTSSQSVDVSVLDAGGIQLEQVRISARTSDITGDRLDAYLNTDWKTAMQDPNLVFTTGAKLITQYQFEALADAYFLFEDNWCEGNGTSMFTTLLGNCNGVFVGPTANDYATTLEQVIAATAWVDPDNGSQPPAAPFVAFNEVNNTSLVVQLVAGGVANYYLIDHQKQNPAQVVSTPTAGTWVRDTAVQGVDMIRVTVPSSFKTLFPKDLSSGLNKLLAVQNSFVRGGDFTLTGKLSFDSSTSLVNGIAKDQILANFFIAAPTLACGTVSGHTVDLATDLEVPITPYSFAQFEGMVGNCTSGAGTVAITAADIKGKRFIGGDGEITQYDNTGSGTLSDPGHGVLAVGVDNIPIAWYLDTIGSNTYIVLTASLAGINARERIALTALTAGIQGAVGASYSVQIYTELDIAGGTIDGTYGEIWNSSYMQVQSNNASSLACGTESGTTVDPVTGFFIPITPYTFTQFEGMVNNCTSGAGTVAITVADIKGNRFIEVDEISQFDNTGSGTQADPGHGIVNVGVDNIPVAWYLDTIGSNTYIVLTASVATGTSAGTVNLRQRIALTALTAGVQGSVGATYAARFYDESDLGGALINGTAGEVWNSSTIQIQVPAL